MVAILIVFYIDARCCSRRKKTIQTWKWRHPQPYHPSPLFFLLPTSLHSSHDNVRLKPCLFNRTCRLPTIRLNHFPYHSLTNHPRSLHYRGGYFVYLPFRAPRPNTLLPITTSLTLVFLVVPLPIEVGWVDQWRAGHLPHSKTTVSGQWRARYSFVDKALTTDVSGGDLKSANRIRARQIQILSVNYKILRPSNDTNCNWR